ncbi:M23 family metallopeptidase [Paraburkholderia adhaesiva]|uniref:M23 family metallopeptidase n=1 Tax=Paraburkholderia adhaesiva TaxID=2883244 RepID=UPI001F410CB9|nr:M23 family metallopeptidase [Paraburkholderia adhaesiva]
MIISPPFLPQSGLTGVATDTDPMMTAVESYESANHGVFPVTFDRRWHGGIHLVPATDNEPVRAIADGEVVAYRISRNPISDGHISNDGHPVLNTNTGFVLLRHQTDTGDGRSLTYYSLYMHLLDLSAQQSVAVPQPATPPQNSSPIALAAWLLEAGDEVKPGRNRKVYRKDILGYRGQSQGLWHLHFEIFTTNDDFNRWFESSTFPVQLGVKNPVQPTSKDWWGHAYYMIPATVNLVARPGTSYDNSWLPALSTGRLPNDNSKLYVEAYFHQGQRYMNAWLDENGDGNCVPLTTRPVIDPSRNAQNGQPYKNYEYELYKRAMAAYPACPSDGYELLRFGRILSDNPTLTSVQDKATWVAVPVDASGTLSYVDINQTSVIKLSDADFPAVMGWRKIDSENAPIGSDGLFSYTKLHRLVGDTAANEYPVSLDDPSFSLNDQMAYYVQRNDSVRAALGKFVCHTVSEWDPDNNKERYKDLNAADGYFGKRKDTDPDGYKRFVVFLRNLQFMDQIPSTDQIPSLSGGQTFWFFHPLAFIRHFRKCGWLTSVELARAIPRQVIEQTTDHSHQTVYPTSELKWSVALSRSQRFINPLNLAWRKYCISTNGLRLSYFLGNAIQESTYLSRTAEGNGAHTTYAPWYGRGVIQLTFEENYRRYGDFKGWNASPVSYRDSLETDLFRACDSAGFYWVSCSKPTGLEHNINAEGDEYPIFRQINLANICTDYSYHPHHSCQVGLSTMDFRSCHQFERAARAVNNGNPDSTHVMNGLVPRTNVFLSAMAVMSDQIIDYMDAYKQKPD